MSEKDCTKLKEFRQLQKEIRGSQEYLIVPLYPFKRPLNP